jgi:hypothetical protein
MALSRFNCDVRIYQIHADPTGVAFNRTQFGQTAEQRREIAERFYREGPAVLLQDWTRVTVDPSKRAENGYRGNVTLTTPASGWFNGVSVTPTGNRSGRQGGILMVVRYRTSPSQFYATYLPISTQAYEVPQYMGVGRVTWCASQIPHPTELGTGMLDAGIRPFHATYGVAGFPAPISEMVGYSAGTLGNLIAPEDALTWSEPFPRLIKAVRIDRYGYRGYPVFVPNQDDIPALRGNKALELLFGSENADFAEDLLGTGRVLPGEITLPAPVGFGPEIDLGVPPEGVSIVPVGDRVIYPPDEFLPADGTLTGSPRTGIGAGVAVAAAGIGALLFLNR